MKKATLTPAILDQLPELNGQGDQIEQVELVDELGDTLGHFLTPDLYRTYMYAWAKAQFAATDIAQARQQFAESDGLTTSQVLDHLHAVIDSHEAGE